MKGPTIWRLPCGSARRTSNPSPRSRVRGTMTSSSASQDLISPSTGSLEGSQLMRSPYLADIIAEIFECRHNLIVVPENAGVGRERHAGGGHRVTAPGS